MVIVFLMPPRASINAFFCLPLPSDPVLHGGAHLPHRLLHQRGGGAAVQAAQQHGGRLLVRAVRALHLLHHSGTPVCGQGLPPWLRADRALPPPGPTAGGLWGLNRIL